MIIWTIDGQPVNTRRVTTNLALKNTTRTSALLEAISKVVSGSVQESGAEINQEEVGDNICIECLEEITGSECLHSRGSYVICDSCVESLPKQCDCCDKEYDLRYLFDAHGVDYIH